jgi:hypothetical protein
MHVGMIMGYYGASYVPTIEFLLQFGNGGSDASRILD